MTWSHIRRLDERSIRYFIVACEEKSVNAAAERLRIAPSAIRRKLRELEDSLGVALLSRSAHGVEPTTLGRVMQKYFSDRFSQDEAMIVQLLERSRLKHGTIKIGLGEGFAADFLSNALPAYRSRYPDILFDIQVMDTDQIVHALEANGVDVGVAFNPPPVQRARIAIERLSGFSCFVPQSWDNLNETEISIEQLAGQPCGLISRNFSLRRLIDDAERAAGVRLHVALETNSLYALRRFVTQALGISIMPDFTMEFDVARGDMRRLAVVDSSLNDIPVRAFVSDLSKDDPPTVELLRIMQTRMALFCGRAGSQAQLPPRAAAHAGRAIRPVK
jgi:DNA-binding transcriptional LysR family regulator